MNRYDATTVVLAIGTAAAAGLLASPDAAAAPVSTPQYTLSGTAIVIVLFLVVVLGVPTWLGLRDAKARNAADIASLRKLPRPGGTTPPGRLVDGGRIMDPDRLERAVE